MPKHGSMLLYVHRNRHQNGKPRTATSTFAQLLNSEATQHGTPLVYKKPGSVRPAWRLGPLPGCSQTGLHLPTGSLPIVCGTTITVNAFPRPGLILAAEEGTNVSVFPAPSSSLPDLIPDLILYSVVFIRLTTGPFLLQVFLNDHVRLRRF